MRNGAEGVHRVWTLVLLILCLMALRRRLTTRRLPIHAGMNTNRIYTIIYG